jgi:anti-sigma regulatory factor (Ser/Thr protein kinase)
MAKEGESAGKELARLRLCADPALLAATVHFVQETVASLGFSADDSLRLGLVVEEACLNVIKHAFEPGEEGSFEVSVERRPSQLVVAVEDQGLPFDAHAVAKGAHTGLGAVLMRAFADEVAFINLGRRGKRVELVKNLPSREVSELLTSEDRARAGGLIEKAPAEIQPVLRLMRAEEDEAVNLARCVYRSYGYSYISDLLYFPDMVLEHLRSGLMISCVAVAPDGEVVGHLALTKDRPGDRVADSGKAVVDPRFRGRHLFEDMKRFLAAQARELGMYGCYSEAVTVHPFTQKGNLALGSHETGYLLAFVPDSVLFKKIEGGRQTQRQTACLFYLRVNPEPEREVFAPPRHAAMLRRIYTEGALRRVLREDAPAHGLPEHSRLDVKVLP